LTHPNAASARRGSARRRVARQPPNAAIDGDVPYQQGWAAGVPPDAGVYLIRDMRGLLYVGRTTDLRRRFHQHLEYSHNELLRLAMKNPWGQLRFAWVVDADPEALEERLIELLMPICNERRYRDTTNTIKN
jgi:excinuclease UvrABC nuclease subunit